MISSLRTEIQSQTVNVQQKQGSQLKYYSTREGLKQMKDVKKCVHNPSHLVKHASKHLPGLNERRFP